jgi:N-methylhydantoinase A
VPNERPEGAALSYRITVDVGGTFTDVVLTDDHGNVRLGKSPTTPDRAFDGIRGGLGRK